MTPACGRTTRPCTSVCWISRMIGFVVLFSLFVTSAAMAAESALNLTGDAAIITDYRFRGLSRSNREVAVQGSLDLSHDNGLFLGTFLSSLKDTRGHDFEVEGVAGYAAAAGPWDLSFSLGYDSFHKGNASDGYFELRSTVSRDFGFAYVRGGLYFAPDDREIGLGRSIYTFGEGDIYLPAAGLPPLTLHLKAGYEDFEGGISKWDWTVGLFIEVGGLEMGLSYVDTNKRLVQGSRSTVIFGIKKYF